MVIPGQRIVTTKFGLSSRTSAGAMEALANAAFPTLPAAAHEPKASLFDLDAKQLILTTVMYGIYPISEKQGKVRAGYMILNPTAIVIYKNEKDHRDCKPAKHFIALENVFNVCLVKEPFQIKNDCLSVMSSQETFYILPTNSEYSIQNWFEFILEKCRVLRSAKLARPVFREEFFEMAWDVWLGPRPKLKQNYVKYTPVVEDLGLKLKQGRRRLCFQSSTIFIFHMGAVPSTNVDAPFDREYFIGIPSLNISSFGNQEHCFILRTGRWSECGSGEMFMQCESHLSAKAMHDVLMDLIRRDSQRRKEQGIDPQPWINNSNARAMKRRERRGHSDAQAHEGAEARGRLGTTQSQMIPMRKASNSVGTSDAIKSTLRMSFKSKEDEARRKTAEGTDEKSKVDGIRPRKKSSIAGLLPSFRLKLTSNASTLKGMADSAVVDMHSPLSAVAPTSLSARGGHGSSNSIDMVDRTAGSSVPRVATAPISSRTSVGLPQLFCESSCKNAADDYMPFDAHENASKCGAGYKRVLFNPSMRKNSASSSHILTPSQYPQSGISKKAMLRGKRKRGASHEKDYLEMDEHTFANSEAYPMKTYSPDDSPRSVNACNMPRTYSCGATSRPVITGSSSARPSRKNQSNEDVQGRCSSGLSLSHTPPSSRRATNSSAILAMTARRTPPAVREESIKDDTAESSKSVTKPETITTVRTRVRETSTPPTGSKGQASTLPSTAIVADMTNSGDEDFTELRKRAHSLGSKTWKKPSFLKIGGKRISRLATPATGTNTASAYSSLPAEMRNTTDNGGSSSAGVVWKMGRQNSTRVSQSTYEGDHVELDFDSSCPSIESPMTRSRNSSLGVQLPGNIRAALDLALNNYRSGPRPSERHFENQYGSTQAQQQPVRKTSVPESHDSQREDTSNSINTERNADEYVVMEFGGSNSQAQRLPAQPTKLMPHTSTSFCYPKLIDTILESGTLSESSEEDASRKTSPRERNRFIVGDEEENESAKGDDKLNLNERKSDVMGSQVSVQRATKFSNRSSLNPSPKLEGSFSSIGVRDTSLVKKMENVSLRDGDLTGKRSIALGDEHEDYGIFILEPPTLSRCSTSSASLSARKDTASRNSVGSIPGVLRPRHITQRESASSFPSADTPNTK